MIINSSYNNFKWIKTTYDDSRIRLILSEKVIKDNKETWIEYSDEENNDINIEFAFYFKHLYARVMQDSIFIINIKIDEDRFYVLRKLYAEGRILAQVIEENIIRSQIKIPKNKRKFP